MPESKRTIVLGIPVSFLCFLKDIDDEYLITRIIELFFVSLMEARELYDPRISERNFNLYTLGIFHSRAEKELGNDYDPFNVIALPDYDRCYQKVIEFNTRLFNHYSPARALEGVNRALNNVGIHPSQKIKSDFYIHLENRVIEMEVSLR